MKNPGKLSLTVLFVALLFASVMSCGAGEPDGDVIVVENAEEFYEHIKADKPVVVDFYADWCRPCKIQGPIVSELSTEMKDEIRVLKLDVDAFPRIAAKYQVRSIPTIIIFQNGQEIWKEIGLQQKETLQAAVSKQLSKKE
ncbi:MAG: thioredoxin [Bacteroidales bacterium]